MTWLRTIDDATKIYLISICTAGFFVVLLALITGLVRWAFSPQFEVLEFVSARRPFLIEAMYWITYGYACFFAAQIPTTITGARSRFARIVEAALSSVVISSLHIVVAQLLRFSLSKEWTLPAATIQNFGAFACLAALLIYILSRETLIGSQSARDKYEKRDSLSVD